MTILLYDYCELEERASKHLRVWKACHLLIYVFAGVFGILNYVFLQNAMQLVDNNCVLYPRELAFRIIDLPNSTETNDANVTTHTNDDHNSTTESPKNAQNEPLHAGKLIMNDDSDKVLPSKDESRSTAQKNEFVPVIDVEAEEVSVNLDEDNHRLVLDTSRTLFGWDSDCQFAEYMPIMSTIFAATWATMFTMCPGGGHARTGLHQPWRILAPALLFALVLVGLTGHSFSRTNGGLHAFCSAFYNVTNSTTCSAASPFLERSWNSTWGLGGRVAAARAASAGAWAAWACAAALCLTRCLTAPDFRVRRTKACLKDPQQKLTPYLKKSGPSQPSLASPSKRDTVSVRSEPTITTELVTASIEHEQDTAPPSLQSTPVRKYHRPDEIELTHTHK